MVIKGRLIVHAPVQAQEARLVAEWRARVESEEAEHDALLRAARSAHTTELRATRAEAEASKASLAEQHFQIIGNARIEHVGKISVMHGF